MSTCCKNLVNPVLLDFAKDRKKRIHFDKETVIFGKMSDDKIINLIIILVKKCIFSLSRKKNLVTFTDIVRYLQTYNTNEKNV